MMAYDCGGGRTGVRMTPARLAEIAAETKGGKPATQAAHGESDEVLTHENPPAPGSLRVSQCQPGKSYVSRGDATNIVGVYRGEEKGLHCFDMADGRTFKL